MPKPESIIAPEVLRTQTQPLSEDQEEAIRERALQNIKKKERGEDVDDDEADEDDSQDTPPAKPDTGDAEDDDKSGDKAESEEERKAREAREAEKDDESETAERQKKIDEAKAKPEDKRTDEEKSLLKEAEEAEAKAKQEAFEREVEEHAEEHGLSHAQARKEVEKIHGVREKYKNDPAQMSKALYHATAKLSQISQELARVKKPQLALKQIKLDGKVLSEEETKAHIVSIYRNANPDIASDLDDEKVHHLAMKEIQEKMRIQEEKEVAGLKDAAEKKRQELLESLPENDKRFLKDVRGALYRASDESVLDEDFDVMDFVYWARGKRYEKDVKEAEERGRSEALKEKKILGANGNGSGGGQTPPKRNASSDLPSLSKEQKDRALDMYDSLSIPDEDKFVMYQKFLAKQNDIEKNRNKKE